MVQSRLYSYSDFWDEECQSLLKKDQKGIDSTIDYTDMELKIATQLEVLNLDINKVKP